MCTRKDQVNLDKMRLRIRQDSMTINNISREVDRRLADRAAQYDGSAPSYLPQLPPFISQIPDYNVQSLSSLPPNPPLISPINYYEQVLNYTDPNYPDRIYNYAVWGYPSPLNSNYTLSSNQ